MLPLNRFMDLEALIEALGKLICFFSPCILIWWFLINLTGFIKNSWVALLSAVIVHCLLCFGFIFLISKKALALPPKKIANR